MPSPDFLALNPGAAAVLKSRRPRQQRAAQPPSAPQGVRCPNGWGADYEAAGRAGWQFGITWDGAAMWCYGWKPGGARTALFEYWGDYATAAGVYRLAVVNTQEVSHE